MQIAHKDLYLLMDKQGNAIFNVQNWINNIKRHRNDVDFQTQLDKALKSIEWSLGKFREVNCCLKDWNEAALLEMHENETL